VSFPYKTIGVVAKTMHPMLPDLMRKIVAWTKADGCRFITNESIPDVSQVVQVDGETFQNESDLIMILGGDGTFLAGGRLALRRDIPILGVNLGTLGFLTEITVEELFPVLELVRSGKVLLETRPLVGTRVKKDNEVLFEGHVINDTVIAKASVARMLEIETRIDGNFLALFKADGLIISTPTGSTAYSLAAGGPIVFPTMEAIIMTPICPHSLNHRPLVVPDHLTITVSARTPSENVSVTLDGQTARTLKEGERVEIAKSPYHLKIIKSPFKTYFDILKSKLRWAEI
jgi:NAD+ kinase